jgi:hypothetical protein
MGVFLSFTLLISMLPYKRSTSWLNPTIFISPVASQTIASKNLLLAPKYWIGFREITLHRIEKLMRNYNSYYYRNWLIIYSDVFSFSFWICLNRVSDGEKYSVIIATISNIGLTNSIKSWLLWICGVDWFFPVLKGIFHVVNVTP